MFTGIIQEIGHVAQIQQEVTLLRYAISFPHQGLVLGEYCPPSQFSEYTD